MFYRPLTTSYKMLSATLGKHLVASLLAGFFSFAIYAQSQSSSLLEAVKNQHMAVARSLLSAGRANVNAHESDGATALHWAAYWDDPQMVDLLIRAGANVNAANDLGLTPLFLACTNRSSEIVKKLLSSGGNANAITVSGESVLMSCARSGNATTVEELLKHGADINFHDNRNQQTALMWAIAEGHSDVVKVLVRQGADIRLRTRVTESLVVHRGEEFGARTACSPAEDPKAKGPCAKLYAEKKGGSTAFLFAARMGDVESARLLLTAGADINDSAADGSSALVIATYSGHTEFAKFLLDAGADPNSSSAGYTALHIAVLRGDLEVVKALLAHHANPNARITVGTPVLRQNQDLHLSDALIGATPVFLAAKFLELDILRLLIAAGGDPLLPTDDGTSSLMAAAGVGTEDYLTRRGNGTLGGAAPPIDDDAALEVVKMMVDLGANVKAANQNGDTSLHGAAFHGYANIIEFLASKGADLRAKNKAGQTPLDLAAPKVSNFGTHDVKNAELTIKRLLAQSGKSE